MSINYVKSRDAIIFNVDGKRVVIPKTHINYDVILDKLEDGEDIEELRPYIVDGKTAILNRTAGAIKYENDQFWFEGEPLHLSMLTRVISLARDGFNIDPLLLFIRNILDNPSPRAREELYGFLEVNDLPVTADGFFIAYKMIQGDWTDIRTGTMDNSVGAVVEMEREAVDPDKNSTCSYGLHFAALHYVTNGSYGSKGSGHRLVAVKINPRDVVAIPTDYKNSKGRACRYTILKELRWDERLPISTTGYKFLREDGTDEVVDDNDGSVITLSAGGVVVGKYTDDEIRAVKRLLKDPDNTLASISRSTGMSRRHVARIRDGEAGTHVTL
jgi:hypothetical protein